MAAMEGSEMSSEGLRYAQLKCTVQYKTVGIFLPVHYCIIVYPIYWMGIQPARDKNFVVQDFSKNHRRLNLKSLAKILNTD
ncbi:hypothetical protein ALQ59_102929 [Pseudomonas syringae pv. apii]|nr:hypothetical protein ALQ59_102929 [Pseudomonas syringae pv. apii]